MEKSGSREKLAVKSLLTTVAITGLTHSVRPVMSAEVRKATDSLYKGHERLDAGERKHSKLEVSAWIFRL